MKLQAKIAALLLATVVTSPAFGAPGEKHSAPSPMTALQYRQLLEQQRSTGPVDCFTEAKVKTWLSDAQAAQLCRCQLSSAPVNCFVNAKTRTFLTDESAMRLCSSGELAPLGCIPN